MGTISKFLTINKKMKSKLKRIFERSAYWTGVITLGLVIGLSIQAARAWVGPTGTPQSDNVGAPINTSAIDQVKAGVLGVLGLTTEGLTLNPGSGEAPAAGKFLVAKNANGEVGYTSTTPNSGGGGVQCIGSANWFNNNVLCIDTATGRTCTRDPGGVSWSCYSPGADYKDNEKVQLWAGSDNLRDVKCSDLKPYIYSNGACHATYETDFKLKVDDVVFSVDLTRTFIEYHPWGVDRPAEYYNNNAAVMSCCQSNGDKKASQTNGAMSW